MSWSHDYWVDRAEEEEAERREVAKLKEAIQFESATGESTGPTSSSESKESRGA